MASKYPTHKEEQALRQLVPKRLSLTPAQLIIEVLTLLVVLCSTAFLLLIYSTIPEQIPTHFGLSGQPDDWSSKATLFGLQGGLFLLYILLTVIEFFPRSWNISVRFTADNVHLIYQKMLTMFVVLKLLCCLVFAYLSFCSATVRPVGLWFLPIFLVVMFGQMAYSLWDIYRSAK